MAVLPVFRTSLDLDNVSPLLVLCEVVLKIERMFTSLADNITTHSWGEAVSILEMLVTRLDKLDSHHKQQLDKLLQVKLDLIFFLK